MKCEIHGIKIPVHATCCPECATSEVEALQAEVRRLREELDRVRDAYDTLSERCCEVEAERDRYREALEQIAAPAVYGPHDMIELAREALRGGEVASDR